jgi:hypothetical protein
MATQRWTDEMLDNLAVSIESLRDTVLSHDRQNEIFRDTILSHDRQNEIFRDTILAHDRQNEERDQQMDLMAIGINRLLEDSREYKQWKVETDRRIVESNQRIEESNQRFNILLEEIRSVTRRVEVLEN